MRLSNIRESAIIDNISQLTGFLLCDIEATDMANKLNTINWAPLFSKKEINHDDLPVWMQSMTSKKTFPRKTLVQSMKESNLLLHTKLASFYLDNGFKISKIHKFIEYEGSKCFENFFDTLYN